MHRPEPGTRCRLRRPRTGLARVPVEICSRLLLGQPAVIGLLDPFVDLLLRGIPRQSVALLDLAGKIQERYGLARDAAQKQVDEWVQKADDSWLTKQ